MFGAGTGNLKYSQLVDLLVKPGEPCEGKGDCLSWAAQVRPHEICRSARFLGFGIESCVSITCAAG